MPGSDAIAERERIDRRVDDGDGSWQQSERSRASGRYTHDDGSPRSARQVAAPASMPHLELAGSDLQLPCRGADAEAAHCRTHSARRTVARLPGFATVDD